MMSPSLMFHLDKHGPKQDNKAQVCRCQNHSPSVNNHIAANLMRLLRATTQPKTLALKTLTHKSLSPESVLRWRTVPKVSFSQINKHKHTMSVSVALTHHRQQSLGEQTSLQLSFLTSSHSFPTLSLSLSLVLTEMSWDYVWEKSSGEKIIFRITAHKFKYVY